MESRLDWKGLFLPWTLLTILSWFVFMPFVVSEGFCDGWHEWCSDWDGTLLKRLLLYGGLGTTIGVFQWIALRKHIDNAYWWLLASIWGCLVGAIVTAVMPFNNRMYDIILVSIPVGILQVLVLANANVRHAWLWILIKAVAWPISFIVGVYGFFVMSFRIGSWIEKIRYMYFDPLVGLYVGFPFVIPFSLITGLGLTLLLRSHVKKMGEVESE